MQDEKSILQAAIRTDFQVFTEKVFTWLNPGDTYQYALYIEAIGYQLMRCQKGEIHRLVTNVPPRHLKSIMVSVAFVAWVLGHDPTRKFICASYSQELSEEFSKLTRDIMMSEWYLAAFPKTRIKDDSNTKSHFGTTQGGSRMATSVGGRLTGMGGDYLIIDDAHKADESNSDALRERVISWYRGTATSRLNNPTNGVIIAIGQRIHEEDLPGWLVEHGRFAHLNLPAIAEKDEKIQLGNGRIWNRKKGRLLNPARQSAEYLDEQKRVMGSLAFAAQYQQRPTPIGGYLVQRDWFMYHNISRRRQEGDLVIQSWDTAVSTDQHNDPSVCITALLRDNRVYILDCKKLHVEHPTLIRRIRQLQQEYSADWVLIESIGVGKPLSQQLLADGMNNVQAIKHQTNKADRLLAESPLIEQGKVYLPQEAPWLADFLDEVTRFPKSKHDDQVDALSQLLYWFRRRSLRQAPLTLYMTEIGPKRDVLGWS